MGRRGWKIEKLYLKSTGKEDATESRGGEGRVGGGFLTAKTVGDDRICMVATWRRGLIDGKNGMNQMPVS